MSEGLEPPRTPTSARGLGLLLGFGLMILFGGVFFRQVLAAHGPRSPLLVLGCLGAFALSFSYIIWCLQLPPFERRSRGSTSAQHRASGYVAALAMAGWTSAVLAWALA